MLPRYLPLFCCSLALLMEDVLGYTSVKPRFKRALSAQQSSKLSVEQLSLELAEKKIDVDKKKDSVNILLKDRCTNIKSVGKPITHNSRYYVEGAWMKDPLRIMGTETIFVMENYHANNELEEFENMEKFKAGVARKTYKLPYYWDGTGAVVYGPYLYYNRADTVYIVKYNLQTEQEEAQISVGSYAPRKNYYQWGGRSGMDLAVDEQGLWVLYGGLSNSKRLYASKIDVNRNVITNSYNLNTDNEYNGQCFIDQYNRNPTTINYAYDTKTNRQWNPNLQFTNQYSYNTMVDYNPREKVLYAWDHRRQVTYPIIFEEPQ